MQDAGMNNNNSSRISENAEVGFTISEADLKTLDGIG
jgi:hypothetical protein